MKRRFKTLLADLAEIACIPLVIVFALVARWSRKEIDVGLGPVPLISYIHHKGALQRFGYSAETFVNYVFYITQDFDHLLHRRYPQHRPVIHVLSFLFAASRYRCLYIAFDGGPLGATRILWRLEGPLLRLARVRTVLLPYGSDVQDMSRSPNLMFKGVYSEQYKDVLLRRREIVARIDHWTRYGGHIVSGVDHVDYMYCWNTLMLHHISIDTADWRPVPRRPAAGRPFRVLHAPNHRSLKGTSYIERAVTELRAEGHNIELRLVEKLPNAEVRREIEAADVIADQLIIGWYAMFAIEAMAIGRPVLCYLRSDLLDLQIMGGNLDAGEIPMISCTPLDVKACLRDLMQNPDRVADLGRRGTEFVERRHSIVAIGATLDRINQSLGIVGQRSRERRLEQVGQPAGVP